MARYKGKLVYDGTGFSGYQRQRNTRTVQGVVEGALSQLSWQGHSILAAGRTDTGVHAKGQVMAFDLDWSHSTDELLRALNAHLPADVSLMSLETVGPEFHPRFDALYRRYQYRIFSQPVRDPLQERYAWRVWPPLDLSRLQQAADHLVGDAAAGGF